LTSIPFFEKWSYSGINTEGVQNLLQHLKPNKATGPDDIPAKFLKEVNIGRIFVVWSGFIFTEHGVNVVVICLSAFALDNLF
jgi:hypothetical protein